MARTAQTKAAAIASVPIVPTSRAGQTLKPRPMTIVPMSGNRRMSQAVVAI